MKYVNYIQPYKVFTVQIIVQNYSRSSEPLEKKSSININCKDPKASVHREKNTFLSYGVQLQLIDYGSHYQVRVQVETSRKYFLYGKGKKIRIKVHSPFSKSFRFFLFRL